MRDNKIKMDLAKACHSQLFVADAPVVIVCVGDAQAYAKNSLTNVKVFQKVRIFPL